MFVMKIGADAGREEDARKNRLPHTTRCKPVNDWPVLIFFPTQYSAPDVDVRLTDIQAQTIMAETENTFNCFLI